MYATAQQALTQVYKAGIAGSGEDVQRTTADTEADVQISSTASTYEQYRDSSTSMHGRDSTEPQGGGMGGHLKVGIPLQPGVLQPHVHRVVPQGFIVSTHIDDTWHHSSWMESGSCTVEVQLA